MKQKFVIAFSLVLLILVLGFMAKDFFFSDKAGEKNPYEYELDKLKNVDQDLITYKEILQFKPETQKLHGITIDEKDRLYISGTKRVFIYNKDGKQQSFFNTEEDVYCMALGKDGRIFLGMWNHIELWDIEDGHINTWIMPNDSCVITSIAIREESVFAADAANKVVYRFDLEGNFLNNIGKKDKSKDIPGFFVPSAYFDLLIGRDDELWVVNPGYHSFESYKDNGDLISTWSKTSMLIDGFSGCCNPSHIAMLSNGSFVTSEKGIERIKIHLPTGEFNSVVASPDKFIAGTKGLDLAVDSEDRIFVLDPGNGLIRVFEEINN
ncbi:hypothetical protein ACFLTI_06690 [Bacteroidota bacterium]